MVPSGQKGQQHRTIHCGFIHLRKKLVDPVLSTLRLPCHKAPSKRFLPLEIIKYLHQNLLIKPIYLYNPHIYSLHPVIWILNCGTISHTIVIRSNIIKWLLCPFLEQCNLMVDEVARLLIMVGVGLPSPSSSLTFRIGVAQESIVSSSPLNIPSPLQFSIGL